MSSKARAHFPSTPRAMAKGRYASNTSGEVIIFRYRSDSTRSRNSWKPENLLQHPGPGHGPGRHQKPKAENGKAEEHPRQKRPRAGRS